MCLTLITWEMRALWLHTGNPRALQNQSCPLPCGLAGPSVVWFVGFMGFVCLVHCLAAGMVPITSSLSWTTEFFTVNVLTYHCPLQPAERSPHLEREKAWCEHGGWNGLVSLTSLQTSVLWLRGQRVHKLSQSHWELATHTMHPFIHSQLFTKGQLRTRHYCFKDWVQR